MADDVIRYVRGCKHNPRCTEDQENHVAHPLFLAEIKESIRVTANEIGQAQETAVQLAAQAAESDRIHAQRQGGIIARFADQQHVALDQAATELLVAEFAERTAAIITAATAEAKTIAAANKAEQRALNESAKRRAAEALPPAEDEYNDYDLLNMPVHTQGVARRFWRQATGFYRSYPHVIATTTRRLNELWSPLTGERSSGPEGLVAGYLNGTMTPFFHDAHARASTGAAPVSHAMIAGHTGQGKTTLVSCLFAYRPASVNRRVAIVDPKAVKRTRADGTEVIEGEHAERTRQAGGAVFKFAKHADTHVNLFDRRIASNAETGREADLISAESLTIAVWNIVAGKKPLTSDEEFTLNAARQAADNEALAEARDMTIYDLIEHLKNPTDETGKILGVSAKELRRNARRLLYIAATFLPGGRMAGLIDRPTSTNLDFNARMADFDISAIADSTAASVVITVISAILQNVWYHWDDEKRVLILDEAWIMLKDNSACDMIQKLMKFGRTMGLVVVIVVHNATDDIPRAEDPNSAGRAVLNETNVRITFWLPPDMARKTGEIFGFSPTATAGISQLEQGNAIWKRGDNTEQLVQHLYTETELAMTHSQTAMTDVRRDTARSTNRAA